VWLFKLMFYALLGLAWVPVVAHIMGRIFKIDRRADVIHYLKTTDGWFIALHEYRPPADAPKRDHPVAICHGLGGNHIGFDFQEEVSVARYLSGRGHRVFLLDLRGAGDSEKVGLCDSKRFAWNFDSYLSFDVPTAIEGVLKITGAKKLHWMGHSMGGMLGYSIAQSPTQEKMASIVAICSPANVKHFKPLLIAKPFLERTKRFYLKWFTQISVPFYEWLHFVQRISGSENLKRGHYALSAANLQDDLPITLLMQFGEWAAKGRIGGADGADYAAGLAGITIPVCVYAGENDITAPPETVKPVFERTASKVKRFHPLGPSYGHKGSYNHMTPLIGRDAREEVYPLYADWLENGYKGKAVS
jgi:pimeloyl-ACP methyl ester carboxylesterase